MVRSCRPALPLRHLVRYYYQMEGMLPGTAMLQPVPARSPPIIEMVFGDRYRVHRLARRLVEDAPRIALVGPKTHRVVDLHLQGRIDAFTIAFQPGGLAALSGLPLDALTNEDFDARGVVGRGLDELYQRLGEVSGIEARARIADECLLRLLDVARAPGSIARIASAIVLGNGCLPLEELVAGSGVGVRQFERRFLQQMGIAPKRYSGIVRFEAALRLKAAQPQRHWTWIAHALGYHDQMHMVHDFRRLCGASPGAIAPQLDMFVQPEVASGVPAAGDVEQECVAAGPAAAGRRRGHPRL